MSLVSSIKSITFAESEIVFSLSLHKLRGRVQTAPFFIQNCNFCHKQIVVFGEYETNKKLLYYSSYRPR